MRSNAQTAHYRWAEVQTVVYPLVTVVVTVPTSNHIYKALGAATAANVMQYLRMPITNLDAADMKHEMDYNDRIFNRSNYGARADYHRANVGDALYNARCNV